MSFKVQVEKQLNIKTWNIILIDSLNEWWEDEHWKMQWKHSQGLEIYIQFLIDPMDASKIWEVIAKKELNNNEIISSLSMSKRKFDIKLKEFIYQIEEFRKNGKKT
ncbi:hypothetical protein DS884_05735 [Tenacibaculum sp. E3R01]|uniref:hypothetical protein n=1 Tax=Tenacibaculum sp. E3R01 TaxID=2267227 RepID=UPI000DEB519D|nr:hypothetical protein [Tenacibaculum sp. E3R01]RBW59240.1 hypothetical protein DS884_05735 [Tenacibaculum sp. E3R01]